MFYFTLKLNNLTLSKYTVTVALLVTTDLISGRDS